MAQGDRSAPELQHSRCQNLTARSLSSGLVALDKGHGHPLPPHGVRHGSWLRPCIAARSDFSRVTDLMSGGTIMLRRRSDRLARGAAVVALLSLAPGLAVAQQALPAQDAAATSAAVAQLQSLSDAFATVAARVRPS